jgi:hypothetical protein
MNLRDKLNKIVEDVKNTRKASDMIALRKKTEAVEQEQKKLRAEAEDVIATIEDKAFEAAYKEKKYVEIYKITRYIADNNRKLDGATYVVETRGLENYLNLKEVLIMEAIIEKGLTAELKMNHDNENMWYTIYAKW